MLLLMPKEAGDVVMDRIDEGGIDKFVFCCHSVEVLIKGSSDRRASILSSLVLVGVDEMLILDRCLF